MELPQLIAQGATFARLTDTVRDTKERYLQDQRNGKTPAYHRASAAGVPHPDIVRYARHMLSVIAPLPGVLVQANLHYVAVRNSLQAAYRLPSPPDIPL
jgi:hypothetical protein